MPKEKLMRSLPHKLVLVFALCAGGVSVYAQNDRGSDPRAQAQAQGGHVDADPRYPRTENGQSPVDRRNPQAGVERQGRLTPEERQTLRRQIDEAGHDLYKHKR
jgi:hypothetical protein